MSNVRESETKPDSNIADEEQCHGNGEKPSYYPEAFRRDFLNETPNGLEKETFAHDLQPFLLRALKQTHTEVMMAMMMVMMMMGFRFEVDAAKTENFKRFLNLIGSQRFNLRLNPLNP